MIRPSLFLLSVWLVAACGSPAAEPPGPDAAPAAVVADVRTLAPGDILEGGWTAGPDDRIVVALTSAGTFGWNIHGHAGGSTTTIVEDLATTSAGRDFAPPAQATWNLLVANRGVAAIDVAVHMELYGAARWNGWGQ